MRLFNNLVELFNYDKNRFYFGDQIITIVSKYNKHFN